MTRRPTRRTPRKRRGRRNPATPFIRSRRSWLLIAGLVALLLVGLGWRFVRAPEGGPRDVVIPPKSGVVRVATLLDRGRVIRSQTLFVVAAELTGAASRLQAGEYVFPKNTSLFRVLRMIEKGEVVRRFVTIPEGMTSRAAAAVIDATPSLTGETPVAPEGALLPETYAVDRGESRGHVVARMRAARDALLKRLWETRASGLPYATPEEAVTLASIVEKETAKPDERPRVAAVFIHRLQKGIRLESDPTVIYPITGGAPLGHGLRVSELQRDTPYNTYLHAGLPPTPIANPGRASLEAALQPAKTDDLYFVADGTGGHVFSADFATHLKNVARWRAIEKARAG